MLTHKTCKICNVLKSRNEYDPVTGNNKRNRIRPWCKACEQENNRRRYQKEKDRRLNYRKNRLPVYREQQRTRNSTLIGRLKYCLDSANKRNKSNFNLTFSYLEDLYNRQKGKLSLIHI